MKPRYSLKTDQALTRIEAVVVVFVIGFMTLLALPAILHPARNGAQRINCVNNLKQVGLAARVWSGDNVGNFPMAVSVTNGGSRELMESSGGWATFQVMSNELGAAKIVACPQDRRHSAAGNFTDFTSNNVSYFVDYDADVNNPQTILAGDDNFEINGVRIKSGLSNIASNSAMAWDSSRHAADDQRHFWILAPHPLWGNICLADGSVQSVADSNLLKLFNQTGLATNRLAIP